MPRSPGAIEKQLTYRLDIPEGQEERIARETAEHWAGFQWETGRVIVAWVSDAYGTIQVWAIGEAEGKGVIQHALAHMGVDERLGQWVVTSSKSARYGKIGTVQPGRVSVRNGPSGTADYMLIIDP